MLLLARRIHPVDGELSRGVKPRRSTSPLPPVTTGQPATLDDVVAEQQAAGNIGNEARRLALPPAAIGGKVRTYYASDLLLVAEVISPRSGSEQVDRVRKVREYARAAIPLYWIVDLEPEAKITILTLRGEEYALEVEIRAGHTLTVSQPFALSLDPVSLTEFG